MCGILGVFGPTRAAALVKQGLASLAKRGQDGAGISDGKQVLSCAVQRELGDLQGSRIVGHTLHSIVGHSPQPLLGNNSCLVANCEIYNWKELATKYSLQAASDSELLLAFLDRFGTEKLEELDGVFAFAYWKEDSLILCRDILGVKPIHFSYSLEHFAFASEAKILEQLGFRDVQELNPRSILTVNVEEFTFTLKRRAFFRCQPEWEEKYEEIKNKTRSLLEEALRKRVPSQKVGLLFSGGIDSTFIAKLLQEQNVPFTCYTTALKTREGEVIAQDLQWAQKIAKEMNLELVIRTIRIEELEEYLKLLVPLIEDTNVVKASVGLTFYLAAQLAKEDACKVLFSGLGSEEIFAGYERHKQSRGINEECLSGLRKIYERDLYRDDVVSMDNSLELRLPFLDRNLVKYALKIPEKYKVKDGFGKWILRDIAVEKGLPESVCWRKKKAAQYGSRIDQAIAKLAKRKGFTKKSDYLWQFNPKHNLKLAVLWSSGKDSNYAAHIMSRQHYKLSCFVTLRSKNPHSYMFQSAGTNLAKMQANAIGVPLLEFETAGQKEEELKDLEAALILAKKEYSIEGVVSGATFSRYQRERIEEICDRLGLKIFAPLWHKPQLQLLEELLFHGYEFVFVAVAAMGLNSSWLGRVIGPKDLQKLQELATKYRLNVAGEGGEFESLVLDGPLYSKRIVLEETKIHSESEYVAQLEVCSAKLVEKKKN